MGTPKDTTSDTRKLALQTLSLLEKEYPNYQTLLQYKNPFELLLAVIMSAQTTDDQVNSVTPQLFKKYPDAKSLSMAKQSDVEKLIFKTGFYKNKAKNIIATSKALIEQFNGEVPSTMDKLITMPGVGRKTAGVVLFHIYDLPAIIVDTHFGRLCRRLAWTNEIDPTKVEFAIRELLPQKKWGIASMVVNFHGRRVCKSRKPLCVQCCLYALCPNRDKASVIK